MEPEQAAAHRLWHNRDAVHTALLADGGHGNSRCATSYTRCLLACALYCVLLNADVGAILLNASTFHAALRTRKRFAQGCIEAQHARGNALHTEMIQLQLGPSTWHTYKVYSQLFTRQFPLQRKQDAGDIIQRGRRMQVLGNSTHASG